MLVRAILFVVMALGLAGFGAAAWTALQPEPTRAAAAPAAPPSVQVLAAARTLRPGTLLKPDDITAVALPAGEAPPGASLDTPGGRADLLGAMALRTVAPGEPLLPSRVLRAGERGFLSAVLSPGMRAATVGVDAVSGTAGLIWPGDRVDVILTQTIDDQAAPAGRRIAGETVLQDARVIAIDQDLMQGSAGAQAAGASQSRTVTLEVTPADAARVAVAARMGHLTLSVISADAAAAPEPTAPAGAAVAAAAAQSAAQSTAQSAAPSAVTWGGDVSAALRGGPRSDAPSGVLHVFEGGAEAKEYRFQ